jgi:hypothetical protein
MNIHKAVLVSAIVSTGVDCTLQLRSKKRYNIGRTLRVGSYAAWSAIPQLFYFKMLGTAFPGNTIDVLAKKTMSNQFLFAPLNISLAIAWDLALQNKCSEISGKISKTMGPALAEGSMSWIPMNLLGFYKFSNKNQFYFFKAASVVYKFMLIPRTN